MGSSVSRRGIASDAGQGSCANSLAAVAGAVGLVGAMVANLTPLAIHGSAFATLTLANNLIGLAPGPILTGRIADAIGLADAFRLLPVPCLLAGLTYAVMRRSYLTDLAVCRGQATGQDLS